MGEFVGFGIDSGAQPVALIGELDRGFVECDIRVSSRRHGRDVVAGATAEAIRSKSFIRILDI